MLRNTHPANISTQKKSTHPAPLHPVIAIGPFSKWGIDYMHCKPTSSRGHGYIIIVIDHGQHFCNQMMEESSAKIGFRHENSMPYYPQANGQVEAINKFF